MLGLTSEGVRYMERMGIIRAHRDKANGYRWFDYNDFVRLTRARSFRALGFSMDETRCMLDGELPLFETRELYSRKLEEVQQRKRELELVEEDLIAQTMALEMWEGGEQAYHFIQAEPMIFCPRKRNGKAIRYQTEIFDANSLWLRAPLQVHMMVVYYGNGEELKGREVSEEDFIALDLPRKNNLIEIRPGYCAHGAIESHKLGWPDTEKIMRWIRSQGREPTGDVYCITRLLIQMDDGSFQCIHEFFAPVREKQIHNEKILDCQVT